MNISNETIEGILKRLAWRLDYSNTIETGSLYNKAWGILENEISRNGVPTDERAYHLCIVGGVPQRKEGRISELDEDEKAYIPKTIPSLSRKGFGKRYF
jgi:hypothetical protein